MNRITLEIGDWSNDGHNQSVTFMVESTLTPSELMTAYRTGVSIVGVDLINDVAKDYEDSQLPRKDEELLRKAGYGFDKDPEGRMLEFDRYDDGDEESPYGLGLEEYLDIFLFICRLGEPHQVIKRVNSHNIDIGGYGLFYP